MKMHWQKRLNIRGPLEQAERCLELWLKEERRLLTEKQHQRVTALMARYFHHDEQVTDQLMLSFLRHYSGRSVVDLEDPTSVRMEIKAVLDKSRERQSGGGKRLAVQMSVFVIALSGLYGWNFTHQKISRAQQAELKSLVRQIDKLDPQMTSAAIWNTVKAPLQIRRYEDMTWWDYRQGREMLVERLTLLQKK